MPSERTQIESNSVNSGIFEKRDFFAKGLSIQFFGGKTLLGTTTALGGRIFFLFKELRPQYHFSSYLPTNIIATFNFQKRYNPFPLVGIKNSAGSFVFGIEASQALPVLEVEADPKCFVSTQLQTRCFGWKKFIVVYKQR